MKPLLRSLLLVAAGVCAGWYAAVAAHSLKAAAAPAPGFVAQCPMHPWVRSAQPGKCTVCGMDLVPASTAASAQGKVPPGAVLLSPASVRATGVQTAVVRRAPLQRTLRVAGRFEEDASTHAIISATVEGRIDGLGLVHDHGRITQRQPLANIFSRTLLAVAREYRDALPHDAVAAAAARRKLEEYGLVWEQIKNIPLRQEDDLHFGLLAPRSGSVMKSYVSEGQYVREGDKLFEITDPTKLWFNFPVAEQDLPFLALGQLLDLQTPSLPGETITAPITAIGRHLDDATHSVSVRAEVENPSGRLPRDVGGAGHIRLPEPEVLAVPRAAVLWPGRAPRVYVEKAPGLFEPRTVRLGRAGDRDWEVLAGVSEGERVVTSSAMLIDGQAQWSAASE